MQGIDVKNRTFKNRQTGPIRQMENINATSEKDAAAMEYFGYGRANFALAA